jgi:hypothetical protein
MNPNTAEIAVKALFVKVSNLWRKNIAAGRKYSFIDRYRGDRRLLFRAHLAVQFFVGGVGRPLLATLTGAVDLCLARLNDLRAWVCAGIWHAHYLLCDAICFVFEPISGLVNQHLSPNHRSALVQNSGLAEVVTGLQEGGLPSCINGIPGRTRNAASD